MPRARRKAIAARGETQDFVKKRQRLGRKAAPSNATSTKVRQRQIYLPNAAPGEAAASADVPQLLARTTHYNTHARASALNALQGALSAGQHPERGAMLRAALRALQDPEAAVRSAGVRLLSVAAEGAAARFSQLLAVSVLACLSHVSADVQGAGANAVAVLGGAAFVTQRHKVLAALRELLVKCRASRRAPVLNAITAVLSPDGAEQSAPAAVHVGYHRLVWADRQVTETQPVDLEAITLRVADVLLECFPVAEALKDKTTAVVLHASARCLYKLLCADNGDASHAKVQGALAYWAKQRNKQHEHAARSAHAHLAACAVRLGRHEDAARYLTGALAHPPRSERGDLSLEDVAEMLLHAAPAHATRVAAAWTRRWRNAVLDGNAAYIAASAPMVTAVVRSADDADGVSEVLLDVPRVVRLLCAEKLAIDDKRNVFVAEMLRLLSNACRAARYSQLDIGALRAEIREHLVCADVVLATADSALHELVASLFYSREVASDAVARLLASVVTAGEGGVRFATAVLALAESMWAELQEAEEGVLELYSAALALRQLPDTRHIVGVDECRQAAKRIALAFEQRLVK